MSKTDQLPKRLRRILNQELAADEGIQWIEQPIPRWFTRQIVGTCLVLLIPLLFFSLTGLSLYVQSRTLEVSLFEFPGLIGIFVFLFGTLMPLILIIYLPIASWLEARQTVYVITNQRVLILSAGWSTTVTSFLPSKLRVISRREHLDGSGDVIFYVHQSKDNDGDIHTQEMGFKQVRNLKAIEQLLYQSRLS